jgi:SAM-dependent methyltransferase
LEGRSSRAELLRLVNTECLQGSRPAGCARWMVTDRFRRYVHLALTAMHPLQTYLEHLRDIRASGGGVAETSYYAPLATLLDEAGRGIKPRVRCIVNLKNTGAGIPDGGFFTKEQFPRASQEPRQNQLPARGALEVKALEADVHEVAGTDQVRKYAAQYGQVLVTNLRDFLLVGLRSDDSVAVLEAFQLAPSQEAFVQLLAEPSSAADKQGDSLIAYLRRALLRPAPLADPKVVAWFLASYAREARDRVEGTDLPALAGLRGSLEASLGIDFEGERGEHLFRSTLVQTLFYGIFSAWVMWVREPGRGPFNWHESGWTLRVPMIRSLFHQLADPKRLQRLRLEEVLDWTEGVLNRVDTKEFFDRFAEEHAIQYFYEPFLEAFDPELRKQLGVWYTPPEVVKYMVAKADHVLRQDLGVAGGFADRRVYVLDPCCGTGAYLLEILKTIRRTLEADDADALVASEVHSAATTRVVGFDIMPAPFVVAHLQVGLFLRELGAPLGESERAGVYLTNSLTGWLPDEDDEKPIPIAFPEMATERDAASQIKREDPVLVVIGNPPYSSYPGIAVGEERELTEAYREVASVPRPEGRGLNDLYVRFFRIAERKITQSRPSRGLVCFISNYSWLDGLSFTGMREQYMERFDRLEIDSLNGDKRRTGKLTPKGDPDPSIFSTPQNREGIQVGTAIATLLRKANHEPAPSVLFRDLWGAGKLAQLSDECGDISAIEYEELSPVVEMGLPFAPSQQASGYTQWPDVPGLFPHRQSGVFTARDDLLVDIDRDVLVDRLEQYFDPSVSNARMKRKMASALSGTDRFDGPSIRSQLQTRGMVKDWVVPFQYRPFDVRWLYWERETKLLDEKRPEYWPSVDGSNTWLTAVRQNRKEFDPPLVCTAAASLHLVERGANLFPQWYWASPDQEDLFQAPGESDPRDLGGGKHLNISTSALEYLHKLGLSASDADLLFHHVVAIAHTPDFAAENIGALRQSWPHVPLPSSSEMLRASAGLGAEIAQLLDPVVPVDGVTVPPILPDLGVIAVVSRVDGGQLDPEAGDLSVTAGWGYSGTRGAVMPGRGKEAERQYTLEEHHALTSYSASRGLDQDEVLTALGPRAVDVYLNDTAYWSGVPLHVWKHTIGGYQPLKKWLSYREAPLLGRSLLPAEVRHFTQTARRIASITLLGKRLDQNYHSCCRDVERRNVWLEVTQASSDAR